MLLKNYMIWIDTCSIMDKHFRNFMERYKDELLKNNQKIYLPKSVLNELKKHFGSSDWKKRSRAEKALILIERFRKEEIFEVYEENNEKFADNELAVIFTKLRMRANLLLITQDYDLASDIQQLGKARSVRCNEVIVRRITEAGDLGPIKTFNEDENLYDDRNQEDWLTVTVNGTKISPSKPGVYHYQADGMEGNVYVGGTYTYTADTDTNTYIYTYAPDITVNSYVGDSRPEKDYRKKERKKDRESLDEVISNISNILNRLL